MPTPVSAETIRTAPKVLLHDHLDGGLRPRTVIDLATEVGYGNLPTTDAEELGAWFGEAAGSGSLDRYLETFAHTVGVMQTRDAIVRVASEAAEDLAADGVVYAEVRYAPELLVAGGLSLEEVVEAVQEGFRTGERVAAGAGRRIRVGTLLCGMRQNDRFDEVSELAVRYRDAGVVGFDIAGPEVGFPPTRCASAFEYLRKNNAHYTIHAGEAIGPNSVWEAVQICGAERLGHGVRIIEDIEFEADGSAKLGGLAGYVRDRQIPLECCPTSNLQTGIAKTIAEHPFGPLAKLDFKVTVNTDNRLMSHCSLSGEFAELAEVFGYGWTDIERFTINAAEAAFISLDDRRELIENVIKPAYRALLA